ncbi:uncharacterized protein LOC129317421 [Prosopis cineraria]|uniref:uncharacterized protein LOC129317421 n=1 Tax=Prosopis cineraria TaxID=364024 RepID=UPI00240F2A06|nr:uncharacterized protein LOC129317421 [Prosopis cineraria]
MGRSIVLEESKDVGKRSRIWSREDIDHVISKNKGSDLIEVIYLQSSIPYKANWGSEAFSSMWSLRILIILCNVYLPHGLTCLPSSLKILEWQAYPLQSLPHRVHLLAFPPLISSLASLKELDISDYNLKIIPNALGCLPSLEVLDLSKNNFENLPDGSCVFPPSFSGLASFKALNISDCNLKTIPNVLGGLPLLEFLDLSENDFSNLLDGNCVLPPSFSCLSSLKFLKLINCNLRDGSIPKDLSCLSSLKELDLTGNKITHLPAQCVANLSLLSTLHLSYCPKLKYLSNLPPNL